MFRHMIALVAVVLAACGLAWGANDGPIPDVPRLTQIAVDGDPGDWGERGFRVEVLPNDQGAVRPPADFAARLRLGWDDKGLLILVTVADDTPLEGARDDALWEGDSVEVFLSRTATTAKYWQFIVSPGLDPRHPEMRLQPWNEQGPDKLLTCEAAIGKRHSGYVLEMRFPWSGLESVPAPGEVVAFQVQANDADGPGEPFRGIWLPRVREGSSSRASHLIRLAEEASEPVGFAASGSYERMRRVVAQVVAAGSLVGQAAELRENGQVVARGAVAAEGGRGRVRLEVPLTASEQSVGEMTVAIPGSASVQLALPDLDAARATATIELALHFRPYVFGGEEFPPCSFEQPTYAEDVLGRYTIERTFYNADYEEVERAEQAGRYGAVVTIRPERGRPLTIFRTLFRMPDGTDLGWYPRDTGTKVELPHIAALDERVLARQATAVGDLFWGIFRSSFEREPATAVMACGLAETAPAGPPTTAQDDFFAKDRQWWVGLKRKLYGTEAAYPSTVMRPQAKDGAPAPVLREGTAQDAGMDPEAVVKLDALLEQWAADSDEGFAVCLARHGVVFLHKAYGQREGRPMTVTDLSWNASITKLLSATIMMMLVDEGKVSLDDPVDKYLPAFRGVEVQTPMTIRHLYTHTCGLSGHWGDEMSDFDQLIGYQYPYLEVGKRFEYNGAGYSLAGKVMELVSGEAIPQFYARHLLEPLGCEHLEVSGNSWDSRAAPMDLAKVGQLLLNRGSYGDKEFFSEETFALMLPRRLTKVLGPETTMERGIGCHASEEERFGKGAFGHGAASSADLIISPEKDMVIVMTRNAAGSNFGEYHPKFLDAVAEAVK